MCTRGLPDIYTLSPRACGPRALGVYIRQTTRAHGITTKYHIPLDTSHQRKPQGYISNIPWEPVYIMIYPAAMVTSH